MSKLSGNKQADMIILQQLTDSELGKVCQVNTYVNSICNDNNFWLNRTMLNFKLNGVEVNKMKIFLGFNTYKELYKYLSTFPFIANDSYHHRTVQINRSYLIELFKNEKMINNVIEENLQAELPEWMNRERLVIELRRNFPEMLLDRKKDNDKKLGLGIFYLLSTLNDVNIAIPYRNYENAKNYTEFEYL